MERDLNKALCDFIRYRETIRHAIRMQSDYIYPVAAAMFLSAGKKPDADELKKVRKLVRGSVSIFSNFRGNTELPLVAILASGNDPEGAWDRTQKNYALLKERFMASEHLALAAAMTCSGRDGGFSETAVRAKRIYKRMRREHPFLTGAEDSVFALLLALDPRSDDELIDDMDECYRLLDLRFPKGNGMQAASHVLALANGSPRDKADRMIELFDAVRDAGGRYGTELELAQLAALSVTDGDTAELARLVMEADSFLKKQKGYRPVFGHTRRTRLMHAALIVSVISGENTANAVASQTALSMIAAQQAAICAMAASSSAAAAAASSGAH
ncbi:MAG: DUF4003 family protein [Clostridia bacterium]|nr:DUF4003 family protein [Clostridia bacterium]